MSPQESGAHTARFSFLLSTPVTPAAVKEVPNLVDAGGRRHCGGRGLAGSDRNSQHSRDQRRTAVVSRLLFSP
jgi:hypothetical protein